MHDANVRGAPSDCETGTVSVREMFGDGQGWDSGGGSGGGGVNCPSEACCEEVSLRICLMLSRAFRNLDYGWTCGDPAAPNSGPSSSRTFL